MAFTAQAKRVGSCSLRHDVDVNGRHAIVTDEPARLGGTDKGPAPHELLPAAVAACIGTTIAMYADRHQWDIGEPTVDVSYETASSPRHFEITVGLPDDLSADQVRRLRRVAETCPLRRALEAGFAFDERLVAAPRSERTA